MKLILIASCAAVMLAGAGVALAQAPAAPAKPAAPAAPPAKAQVGPAPIVTPATPAPSYLAIKDFMRHVVNPAAEAYWAASGIDEDETGKKDKAPKDDSHWSDQYDHAAALQEAGNLLLAEGRRIDDPVWIKNANKLILGGQQGIKASIAKDAEAGFDAGSTLYEACYDCHGKYVVRPQNSLYGRELQVPKPDGETRSLR